jgi:hypothetical protein
MKRVLILCLISFNYLLSQSTFSKIYTLESSVFGSHFNEIVLYNGNNYIFSIRFCTFDPDIFTCTKILRTNLKGENLEEYNHDTLALLNNFNMVSLNNNDFFLSTGIWENTQNYFYLGKYNEKFQVLNSKIIKPNNTDLTQTSKGVFFINNNLYTLSNEFSYSRSTVPRIILSSIDTNTLKINWSRSFTHGGYTKDAHDLQTTYDGNLAFIMNSGAPAGVSNIVPTFKILKISTEGNVLDSFQCKNNDTNNKVSLLVSKTGDYYFCTREHPIKQNTYTVGSVNKLNKKLELEWSVELPNNQLIDGRYYKTSRIKECKNGDILTTGRVRDTRDSKIPGGDLSTAWSGFICRMSPNGSIKWLRIYKLPQELLDIDVYGQYRYSDLNKAEELDNGDIIACGDAFYSNWQLSALDPYKVQTNQVWQLRVDSLGCLEGYPCDTIIRIRPKEKEKVPTFNIGTTWTYEEEETVGPGYSIINFKKFAIRDTVNLNGRKIYLIWADSMYYENDKMYFWDQDVNKYQMYYDFSSTTKNYNIEYLDPWTNKIKLAEMSIDSVYNTILGKDTILTQLIRIRKNGDPIEDRLVQVYKNIGAGEEYVKLIFETQASGPHSITKLRCFNSDTIAYNFQNYPCDSTWFTTETNNLNHNSIQVFPNPTNNYISISGLDNDVPFELLNMQGEIIEKAMTKENKIHLFSSGAFILKLFVGGQYICKKIIKY